MKTAIGLLGLGLGLGLAVIIGQRMSTDAMAVVIGVAVGVAASVPTSLLLVAVLRRQRSPWPADAQPTASAPQIQQPNFIMLNPDMFRAPAYQPMPPVYGPDGGLHKIKIIGDSNE